MDKRVTWPEYLSIITDGAPGARIAQRADIPESTISRWLSGKADPRPRQVVAVARAFDVNPIQALVAAGYLDEGDVELGATVPRKLQLRDFTELELMQEVVRRVEEGSSAMLEAPLDEKHPAMNNVSPIRKDAKPRVRERGVANNGPATPVVRDTRVITERIRTLRNPEAEQKKAALSDPEMNNDENFD